MSEAAVGVQAGKRAVLAVHVLTLPAAEAEPAGSQRVDDHGIAAPHAPDSVPDRLDPAGVLMAERVGQLRLEDVLPDPLDDVQVGAAEARAADPHDHVMRVLQVWLADLVEMQVVLLIAVQSRGLHAVSFPYLVANSPRQIAPLPSIVTRIRRARRRWLSISRTGRPAGSLSTRACGEQSSPSSARTAR
jgi:hypothetical protein